MGLDGLEQVAGAAIMQEENALAYAPQRRGAELPSVGVALSYAILQPYAHVVHRYVRERAERYVALARKR